MRPGSPDAAVEGSEPPRTNVRRVALAVAGVMVLLFGVLIVATTRSDDPKESASSPLVGAEAPPLVADTLDGDVALFLVGFATISPVADEPATPPEVVKPAA